MQEKNSFNFPIVFEVMIWLFYVGFYKYSYLVENSGLPIIRTANFPYPAIGLYAILSTLYLIPYYRWIVPKLLNLKRYVLLFLITIAVFVLITTYNNIVVSWMFLKFTDHQPVALFFSRESVGFFMDWNMIMTDFIAFLCVAFARFSYLNQQEKYQVQRDNLNLQLTLLKNQLQPHFLFNTLNSLYGMSLIGAKDTPRFILLLSNMMQYILYECNQPLVSMAGELKFMQGYFELEQKKYPDADIQYHFNEPQQDLEIPPMLLLPLIENSFKHGNHKITNNSSIYAELSIEQGKLQFIIKNDKLAKVPFPTKKVTGGIGLVNIKKRLELFYSKRHELVFSENEQTFSVKLTINL